MGSLKNLVTSKLQEKSDLERQSSKVSNELTSKLQA